MVVAPSLTVAVDVDEVCADMMTEWCRLYNAAYKDCLTPQMIRGWDMVPNVAKECGAKIYDFLREPDFYTNVRPIPGTREAVASMREAGHRVVFVSSCVTGTLDDKVRWLERYSFLPNDRMTQADFIACGDKSLIRADILFDDRVETCEKFPGLGVVVTVPHNSEQVTRCLRVAGLWQAPPLVGALADFRANGLSQL